MFTTPASKTPSGNYQVEAVCSGPLHHTVFKNMFNTNGPYRCPYDGCGHSVV